VSKGASVSASAGQAGPSTSTFLTTKVVTITSCPPVAETKCVLGASTTIYPTSIVYPAGAALGNGVSAVTIASAATVIPVAAGSGSTLKATVAGGAAGSAASTTSKAAASTSTGRVQFEGAASSVQGMSAGLLFGMAGLFALL
jgi:hypothetical protein